MSFKVERKKIAANYRINEPIRNLKIRIKVVQQRSPLAELLDSEGETRDSNFLEEENFIFSWQEKVFSLFEIDFYENEKNCLNEYQREYHQRIRDEHLQGARLYTYTENDSYYPDNDLLSQPYRSYLSIKNQSALPILRNRKPFSERYNRDVLDNRSTDTRIRCNHYLYTDRVTLYVMADLSRKDEPVTRLNSDSETLLCTITYDKVHKLLTVNPDFTDDEHYNVSNSFGIKYNYWIEHVSEKQTALELQEQREDTQREIQQRLAYKEVEIYKELQLASANTSTLFLNFDIASAHGFSYGGLFVTYFIDLPQYWSTKEREKLSGRTQKCRLQNKSAYFSYCSDIALNYSFNEFHQLNTNTSLHWPCLLLSVASLDDWLRYRIEGYAALSLPVKPGCHKFTVPTWRAKGNIIDMLRRFFVGGSYELEDITYCNIPMTHEGKILDKSNLKVVSSGNIKININIIHQYSTHMKYRIDDFGRSSTDVLINNVENVLEQFKAAKERMIQIREMSD